MDNKFKNVPLEIETRLISAKAVQLDKFEVLHQVWSWEGIKGESIIFADEDVQGLSEDEIKKIVRDSDMLEDKGSNLTFAQKGNGFTFVNFNFSAG